MEKKAEETRLVVLDTSIFVDFLREYLPALSFFSSFVSKEYDRVLFSAITATELISGKSCNNSAIKSKVEHMLASLAEIEVSHKIAVFAGDIRRKYDIDIPDAVVAATALSNKAELLTKNVGDFKDIEGLIVREPY